MNRCDIYVWVELFLYLIDPFLRVINPCTDYFETFAIHKSHLSLYLCYPADPQPKDYVLYYGFSNFAMEMNELMPELEPLLPPTDTRLRPDQRWVYKHTAGYLAEYDTNLLSASYRNLCTVESNAV